MSRTHRRVTLLLVIALGCLALGFASTPAAAQDDSDSDVRIEVNTSVTAEGEIDSISAQFTTTEEIYQQVVTSAENQGSENAAAYLAETTVQSSDAYGGYTNAQVTETANGYVMSYELTDINVSASDTTNVTADGDTVKYVQTDIGSPDSNEETVYRIQMPGEITDTNAIETDGNTAIYRLHEEAPSSLNVEASASAEAEADASDDSDSSGESGPGFGPVAALVAIVAALALASRRR